MFQHRSPRERYAVVAISGLFLLGAGYVGAARLRQPDPLVIQPAPSSEAPQARSAPESKVAEVTEVVVHVAGAVRNPGLRRLRPGARVDDAVHASGGAKPNADLDRINLAAKLEDGTVVYVPPKAKPGNQRPEPKIYVAYRGGGESSAMYSPDHAPRPRALGGTLRSSPNEVAPVPLPDIRLEPDGTTSHRTRGAKKEPSEPVDLNTATLEQLETLPGVGPATAQKILDYRQEHGRFSTVDELEAVKGIGPKKLEKMRTYLRI